MTKGITRKQLRERLNKHNCSCQDFNPILLKEFKEKMKQLTDSRQQKKCTYKIWDVVIVVLIATLANQDTWEDIRYFAEDKYDFFRSFLKMSGGIPSAKTYERIFSIIKPNELEDICTLFVMDILKLFSSKRDIISFDGKTDNSSSRNENELRDRVKSLNVLNVYSNNYKMCIASEMIDDKTNEITTIPTIINRINIKEAVVTWDALNTQKDNIEAVVNAKADYVVALKANHESFYNDIVLYFDDKTLETIIAGNPKSTYLIEHEKSHSSVITYEYFQTEDIRWFHNYKDWKSLHSFGLVRKTIVKNNKTTVEKRFYISSLFNDIKLLSSSIRSHWNVENKLHWQLDYTFHQDDNTTMNKYALMNLQLIRKMALSLIKDTQDIYSCSLRTIRNRLSYNFDSEIFRFFNIISRH